MKKIIFTLLFTLVYIFTYQCVSHAESNINAIDIQQLKETISKDQVKQHSKLVPEYMEETKESSIPPPSKSSEEPIYEKEVVKEKKLSIYENILHNKIINPDSILKQIEIFGLSVFNKTISRSFAPDKQISVPADYPVSSGDEVIIMLWGRINEEIRTIVDRNGNINIPRIGPVSVAGLPFNVMQKNIINRIQNIEGVQASVSMGTLSNIRIFIIGEVNSPGQYIVNPLSNVVNAIYSAGGFSKRGSIRNVQLKRNGKLIKTFDLYDFLLSANSFSNVRLKTGDVIFVPIVKKMAAIAGNVRRCALYELKGKTTTLSDLISLAGGLTPAAWVNRIQIERFQDNEYQVVLDLEASSVEEVPSFDIHDGDIVKIFPVVILDKNAIYLSGNVLRPGKYEYRENMKISDLVARCELLLPETYFNYAVIRRRDAPSYSENIISFNLGEIFENIESSENKELKPLDHVIVYNRDYFEPDRRVSIYGAVTKPGNYKLLENMRIKDLILEAGGLTEKASTDRGELYKRSFHEDSVFTEKIDFCVEEAMNDNSDHNLPLTKSDYVFIRGKRGWEDQKTIKLKGEFVFPGVYVLLENETLGELIERAGGFKPEAFLPAAILTRVSVKNLERKRTQDYIDKLEVDIATIMSESASKGISGENEAILAYHKSLLEKLKKMEYFGRVVLDFEKPENYRNLQVEDGDMLFVPKKQNTVSIIGEVFNPSTFVLENDNKTVFHYIQLSGGYKDDANKRNCYVIKANGSVRTRKMVNLRRYTLESGDAVVVPRKLPYRTDRFKIFMSTTETMLSIVSHSLLIAATLSRL